MRKKVIIGTILATLPFVGVHAMPDKEEGTKHPKSKPAPSQSGTSTPKKGNEGGNKTPGKSGFTGEKMYLD
jgi:hypothetical protein